MKRNILKFLAPAFLLSLSAMISCSDETDDTVPPSDGGIYVSARLPKLNPVAETRYESEDYSLLWVEGDCFSMFYQPEGTSQGRNNVLYTLGSAAGSPKGDFNPAKPVYWVPEAARQTFYMIYPYSATYGTDPDKVRLSMSDRIWITDDKKAAGEKPIMFASVSFPEPQGNNRIEVEFVNMFDVINFDIVTAGSVLDTENILSFGFTSERDVTGELLWSLTDGMITGEFEKTMRYDGSVYPENGRVGFSASILPIKSESEVDFSFRIVTENYTVDVPSLGIAVGSEGDNRIYDIVINLPELIQSDAAQLLYNEQTDLSSQGPANTYIVSKAGSYTFDAKMPSEDGKGISFPNIAGAEWVWMSGNHSNIISASSVKYNSTTDKISFSIPNFTPGSALISVYDEGGFILWSWLIWVTDLLRDEYSSGDMMKYNLGATSFDRTADDYKTLGHYYQWGFPYPLIGAGEKTISDPNDYGEETTAWKSSTAPNVINSWWNFEWNITADIIQNDYLEAVLFPTIMYNGPYNSPAYRQTEWPSFADPCPPGWRVPTSTELLVEYFGMTEPGEYGRVADVDDDNLGFVPVNHPDDWWPLAGIRRQASGTGAISNLGDSGYYHTANKMFNLNGLKLEFIDGPIFRLGTGTVIRPEVNGYSSFYANDGASVRCIKK